MAALTGLSSPCALSLSSSRAVLSAPNLNLFQWRKQACFRKLLSFSIRSLRDTESEVEPALPSPSSSSSPSPSPSIFLGSGDSTFRWSAGLGAVGVLETAYLTYLKLTDSDAFCPVGGGSCGDVLNSDYAVVFGVPLPLIGIVAYGFVTILSLQLSSRSLPFGIGETLGRLLLLGSTTSMAAASTYFLYTLSTKFSGASCSYCLLSAFLSLSLFSISLKDVRMQEIQKVLALQLFVAVMVVAALSTSYSSSQSIPSGLAEIELPYFTTEITTRSSPFAISLAKYLRSIGAKMYGAFWCSHCLEQKQMFGQEASKLLDYVECFPNGYRKGTKIEKACADAAIEGFPTWVINGKKHVLESSLHQVISGEQELTELAEASGFNLEESKE